jgi:hypothetical protein
MIISAKMSTQYFPRSIFCFIQKDNIHSDGILFPLQEISRHYLCLREKLYYGSIFDILMV